MQSTSKQRQYIGRNRLNFFADVEEFRDFLEDNYGRRSATELTKSEAADLIDCFKAWELGRQAKPLHRPGVFASHWQREKIKALAEVLYWGSERVNGMIKRVTGAPRSVDMLTNAMATKVIIALQRIVADGDKEVYTKLNKMSADQVRNLPDDEVLTRLRNLDVVESITDNLE